MKRPAIFFDRDNTLIVGNDYLGDPAQVVLMNGAADAVARARELGFATVIVSNQSGVARGMFDEDAVHAVNLRLEYLLSNANPQAVIDRQEFCPFHPEGTIDEYRRESEFRKPRPGMLISAAKELQLDLSKSWMIGDAPRDIEAARAAGCRAILFQPSNVLASPAALEERKIQPDKIVARLEEAIEFIARQTRPPQQSPPIAATQILPAHVARSEVTQGEITPDKIMPGEIKTGEITPREIARPESSLSPAGENSDPSAARADETSPGRAKESASPSRLENLIEQLLTELKRPTDDHPMDFSVPKLLAGIAQILALALLFVSYLNRSNNDTFFGFIFCAQFVQTLTISLLIMGKQR